jgi:hypothetical protein
MANFQEEVSTQIKRLRDHVETFVHDKVNPTVEKATARIKSTVETTSRLDALIALLVAKGVITDEELKGHIKPDVSATTAPDMVPPPTQDQV